MRLTKWLNGCAPRIAASAALMMGFGLGTGATLADTPPAGWTA